MTGVEKAIVRELQFDFPVAALPFNAVAARLGISGGLVIRTARRLAAAGVLRHIGPAFNLEPLAELLPLAGI